MTQKKTQKKSLKEFIDGAPGAALPVQALLPTKPGQGPSKLDYGVADKFSRISLSSADNHGSHKSHAGSGKPYSVTGTGAAAGGDHWASGLSGRDELPHHPPPPPPPSYGRSRYGGYTSGPPPPSRLLAGDYTHVYGGTTAGYPYDAFEPGHMSMPGPPPPPPHPHFMGWDAHRQWDAGREFATHGMLDFHDLPPPPPPSMVPGAKKPAYNRNAPPPVARQDYDMAPAIPYPAYPPAPGAPYCNSYPMGPAPGEHEYPPAPPGDFRDYPVTVEHYYPPREPAPGYMDPASPPTFAAPPQPLTHRPPPSPPSMPSPPVKLLQRGQQQQQPHSALVDTVPPQPADNKVFSSSPVKQQGTPPLPPPVASPTLPSPRSPLGSQQVTNSVPPAVSPARKELTAPAKEVAKGSTEMPLLADVETAPQAQPAPTVRNEFAERLAQQALSRLASKLNSTSGKISTAASSVKSDLLHEAVSTTRERSTSPTTTTSVAGDGSTAGDFAIPVERPRLVPSPRSHLADATIPSHVSSSLAPSSATLTVPSSKASSDEGSEEQRPHLKLQPRTVPLPQPTGQVQDVDTRRKLQLQPRSSKDTAASADNSRSTAAAAPAGGKSSIFGQARPREEVLRERGVDAVDSDLLASRHSIANSSAHHGYGSSVKASRAGSVASLYSGDTPQVDQGGAGQWQTVGKPRTKPGYRDEVGTAAGHDDVLLGAFNSRPAYSQDTYHHDGFGRSNYGSGFGSRHGREESEADGNGFVFKRALPVRSNDI